MKWRDTAGREMAAAAEVVHMGTFVSGVGVIQCQRQRLMLTKI